MKTQTQNPKSLPVRQAGEIRVPNEIRAGEPAHWRIGEIVRRCWRRLAVAPFLRLVPLLLLSTLNPQLSTAFAQGTAFTYQGRLAENGVAFTGDAEFQPTLWDAAGGGTQVATNVPVTVVVAVTNGLFVLPLDFGSSFPGAERWLQLEVRTTVGAFTTLSPRQQLTATPHALTARSVTGSVSAAQLTGTIQAANIGPGTIASAMLAPGSVHSNALALGSVTAVALATGSIHSNHLAAGSVHSNALVIGSIHSNHLAAGSVHSNALALGSVTASALASGSIHSNHLAAGSVHSNALVIGSIHSNHLAAGSVHSNALAFGSVTTSALASGSIHSNHLAAGSVHSNALVIGSIHSNHLAAGSVHSNALALGSVTASALASGSIHSNHLAAGSVHSNALALGSVTASALASGSIHSNHLAAGSVHSNALVIGSVTASALASGSIHSNHLAIGAVSPDRLTASLSGSFSTTLTDPTTGFFEYFGVAVAAVGPDKLLVGAYQDSTGWDNGGAAYLLSTSGAVVRTLLSPAPENQEHFGFAVASMGQDKVLIGADGNDTGALDAGAAYLLSTNGTLITVFTNPTPAASDFFGYSVAAVGADKVLIGAHGDHFGANAGGAAYLFATNRTLLTTFTNPTPASGDRFGITVAAVGGEQVLIGADRDDGGTLRAGVAYLFHISGALLATFMNPTPAFGDAFGSAVTAVGLDKVLIGATGDNSGGNDGGAAYLFDTSGTLLTTLTNPTPASGDQFGIAVAAVDADHVLIGAASDDSGATDAGAAYLLRTDGALLSTFHNPSPAYGDLFGNAVTAVGSDKLLVGAFQDDAGATDAGAVHLFTLESYTPGLVADTVRAGSITAAGLQDGAITAAKLDATIGLWTQSGSDAFRPGGNVGIGTASPQAALHVRAPQGSQLRLQDSVLNRYWDIYTESFNSSGNLLFLNDIGVAAWLRRSDGFFIDGSDARLKRDINPLEGVLERMLQLRPVSYRLRSGGDDAPLTLGLIAQEVEPLFPEVVGEHEGVKGLAYSQLVPVTVGAIQELSQKVKGLDGELKRRDAEVAHLKARLAALEQLITQLSTKED